MKNIHVIHSKSSLLLNLGMWFSFCIIGNSTLYRTLTPYLSSKWTESQSIIYMETRRLSVSSLLNHNNDGLKEINEKFLRKILRSIDTNSFSQESELILVSIQYRSCCMITHFRRINRPDLFKFNRSSMINDQDWNDESYSPKSLLKTIALLG